MGLQAYEVIPAGGKGNYSGLYDPLTRSRFEFPLGEIREGYAYRLRAIGHLFRAEDESQEWRERHAAIRAARKAYQADRTMPDWEALAASASSVAATGGSNATSTVADSVGASP